ncbi:MAG: rane protein AbrB duplication [Proteobacteria bacterium]|nr:rane protein AbrB duplication [Pseudomonadota bacterium]
MNPFRLFPQAGYWLALLALSLISAGLLQWAAFPAAFLVGPMLTALVFSLRGIALKLPRRAFVGAQAIIGCVVAQTITTSIVASIARDGALMLLIVGTTVVAGGIVGWVVTKMGTLPGSTAAWGSSPGGASAMIGMAEEYGADVRLVAFMQYLRVLIVVLSAAMATHFLQGNGLAATAHATASGSLAVESWGALALTLGVAVTGACISHYFRIPGGALLVPMLLGAVLHASGLANLALPFWLPACAYIALGWYVGLGFNRSTLVYALRALPVLLLATLLLIVLCGFSAWMLTRVLHTDPLTAYLATSPGGLDSVTIIALGSHADIPFVLAVQTLRVFVVILTGPWIAKLICRYS